MDSSRSSPPPKTPLKPAKRKIPPSFATQTPHKPSSARRCHVSIVDNRCNPTNLGRYELLCKFFDCLDSSIRLLRLKGSMCSFTNICSKIESLIDRRFTYEHLGQLKYIMPEVIDVKRVNVFDERTSCMKPELCVSISVDAVECDEKSKSESKNLHLRKVFRARLANFVNEHPEIDEVPVELLPEPYNHSNSALKSQFEANDAHFNVVQNRESSPPALVSENHPPAIRSHFPSSYSRHFSKKVAIHRDVQQSDISAPESCHQETSFNESNGDSTRTKTLLSADNEQLTGSRDSFSELPLPCLPATAIKVLNTESKDDSAASYSTPAKFCSASLEFMSTTPALPSQRICYMTPDDDSISSKDKLVRRPTRPRSLKFEDSEGSEGNFAGDASVDDDLEDS